MDRAFSSGALGTPPSAPGSPSIGYATSGNPGTGTPSTKPGAYWYHMITEEIRSVLVAAGLTPSQADVSQLLQALPGALASRPEMARSLAANGYQKLPGGLILQWGQAATVAGSAPVTFPVSFPTAARQVVATCSQGNNSVIAVQVPTTSGVVLNSFLSSTGATNGVNVNWLAVGN